MIFNGTREPKNMRRPQVPHTIEIFPIRLMVPTVLNLTDISQVDLPEVTAPKSPELGHSAFSAQTQVQARPRFSPP